MLAVGGNMRLWFRKRAKGTNNLRVRLEVSVAAVSLFLLLMGAAFAGDPDPLPKVPKGDPAMNAAFARAAAGLDGFFAKWRNPPPGAQRFTVKIGLVDTTEPPGYAIIRPGSPTTRIVEWFWVTDLLVDGTGFSGRLGNDPDALHNVAYRQAIHFTRQDIGDWMYRQDGKIIGNATACPALAHASAEERRMMKEKYGLACD
jgi:uncharacterized protein YegJ (DUF2314 family)